MKKRMGEGLEKVRKVRKTGKVALGLSGGVDSAVSAYLLKKQGFDVSCIYLNCYDSDTPGCRGDNDRKDALAVAMHLGLPFQVLDFRKQYQAAVIDYFKKEYLAGRTPNPDVICNRDIKFGLFLDWAIKEGFDYMATGHYVKLDDRRWKIEDSGGRSKMEDRKAKINKSTLCPLSSTTTLHLPSSIVNLARPADERKDQTYFLWAVPKEKFKRVLFPLGNLLKTEVREIALKIGLSVAKKKDSTGICFVGEVRVEDFLKQLGVKEKIGEVVIRNKSYNNYKSYKGYRDQVIGHHRGVWFYTIGQRHGFEISSKLKVQNSKLSDKPPLYVIEKDVKKNRLIVGFGSECYRSEFKVGECNWLAVNALTHQRINPSTHCFVRLRHGGELIPCSVVGSPLSVISGKSTSFQSAGSKPTNRQQMNQKPKTENPARLRMDEVQAGGQKLITVVLSASQRGIAPGQSAVFYDKNGVVLGGGVIQ